MYQENNAGKHNCEHQQEKDDTAKTASKQRKKCSRHHGITADIIIQIFCPC